MNTINVKCEASLVGSRDEKKALELIGQIQDLQYKLYGKQFREWQFNGNTVEELQEIKNELFDESQEGNHPIKCNLLK